MVSLHSHATRLGVLDIGSNTIHMLIVDAAPGARPDPEASTKSTVRLMKYLKDDGSIKKSGIEAILTAVDQCMELAEEYDITQLLAMATSAISLSSIHTQRSSPTSPCSANWRAAPTCWWPWQTFLRGFTVCGGLP